MIKTGCTFIVIFSMLWFGGHPCHASQQEQMISTKQLKYCLDQQQDVLLVNVLPKIIHNEKHIPGSVNIPLGQIMQPGRLPQSRDTPLVFYCMGWLWLYSSTAAGLAAELGYTNVKVYRDGILGWVKEGYPLISTISYPKVDIPLISSIELSKEPKEEKVLIDIRPDSHFAKGHIEGSINIDLEDLDDRLDVLPNHRELILIDHKGKLTLTTGRYLRLNGFKTVLRLDGGFNAWAKSGLDVVK